MDTRAEKCVFIGPTPNKRGYKCFNPRTRKIQISMDVSFLENQPYFAQNCLQGEREIRTSFLGNICTFTRFSNQYSRNNLIYLCRVIDYHKYGGEIFPTCESLVYTMKGFHHTRKDQPKIPIQVQSSSPSTDPSDIPDNPSISVPPTTVLPNTELSNLDIPTARRKGV